MRCLNKIDIYLYTKGCKFLKQKLCESLVRLRSGSKHKSPPIRSSFGLLNRGMYIYAGAVFHIPLTLGMPAISLGFLFHLMAFQSLLLEGWYHCYALVYIQRCRWSFAMCAGFVWILWWQRWRMLQKRLQESNFSTFQLALWDIIPFSSWLLLQNKKYTVV